MANERPTAATDGDERKLADFFDNASLGLHWVGPDGIIRRANQAELDMLGYRREEYVGHHIAEFHVDRPVVDDMLERLVRGETLRDYPARMRAKDGTIRDVVISSNALFEDGEFVHTRCVTQDVTEQKRTEVALKESEARFRTLADAAPVLIWMTGPNKETEYVNQTWLTFTGQSAEDAVDDTWLDLVHPDDRQTLQDVCMDGFRNRKPFTTEFRLRRADGEYRWMFDTATPRFDPSGAFCGFIGSCVDISERKLAEEAHTRLAAIVESSDDAIIGLSLDGNILSWNRGAERLYGYTAAEAVGRSMQLVIPPELQDQERAILARIARGEMIAHYETERVSKQGRRIRVSLTSSPVRDRQGRVVGASKVARDITADKLAEAALRDSEERLRLSLEAGRMGTWEWFLETNQITWSPGLESIHGLEPGTFAGTLEAYQADIHPDDREKVNRSISRTLQTGQELRLEYRIHWPDGSLRWVEGRGKLFRNAAGAPERMIGVCVDITERKQVEEALAREQELLQTIIDKIPVMVTLYDPDVRLLRLNREFERVVGWTTAEAAGISIMEECYPDADYRAEVFRFMDSCREGWMDFRLRTREGREIETSWANIRLSDQTQVGIGIDISERKRAERALREGQRRLSALVETAVDGIITIDQRGTIESFNPAAERMFGYQPSEVIGQNVKLLMPAPYRQEHDGYLANYLQTGTAKIIGIGREVVGRRKDGSTFPLELAVSEFELGGERYFTGIVRDVTDRKRIEQGLRFLADASATLAALTDYKSTLQIVASLAVPTFADWCAVDVADSEGMLRRLAVVHTDPAKVQLAHRLYERYPLPPEASYGSQQVFRTGESEMIEEIPDSLLVEVAQDEEHLRSLRELGLKSYMSVPLRSRGSTLGVISFVLSDSGRRYSAAELAFAEELARRAAIAMENAQLYQEIRDADRRKDEFLATLAHELRNPLAPIRNMLEIVKRAQDSPHLIHQASETMDRQLVHLVRLVDDLLDVSRITRDKLELRKERTELATVLQQVVESCRPQAEQANQRLELSLSEQPVYLDADPVRLAQVFSNLVNNACKYTEPGGTISVTAQRHGRDVAVSVKDSGIGIAPEALAAVFDLFTQVHRSLDRASGGLGIGLTLVKRLVEMHGGSVEALSEGWGRGSEFVVRLPMLIDSPQTEPPLAADGDAAAPDAPAAARRILVVDDNQDTAASLAMLLKLSGHQIRTAHDGIEAIEAAERFRPELLLLDIGLPRMNGYEACRAIRQQPWGKSMVVVALSGWGQEEDRRKSQEAGFDGHLVKPVDHAALVGLLSKLQPVSV